MWNADLSPSRQPDPLNQRHPEPRERSLSDEQLVTSPATATLQPNRIVHTKAPLDHANEHRQQ